jgi:hypothetical protein
VLHPLFVSIQFLLVLCSMQIVFELSKDVLVNLYPLLFHRSPTISEHNLHKSKRLIIVQGFERGHTNRHVVDGVLAILTQINPFDPSLLFPCYIVSKIPLHPLVYNFCLSICLWMVANARGQINAHQSKIFLPKDAHEFVVPITHNGLR